MSATNGRKKGGYTLVGDNQEGQEAALANEEGTPQQGGGGEVNVPGGFRVKILDTSAKEYWVGPCTPSESVESLKRKIAALTEVAPPQQRLIYRGRMLQDGQTLEECGVQDQTIVHLFARPAGPVGGVVAPGTGAARTGVTSLIPGLDGTGEAGQALTLLGPYPDPDLLRSSNSVKLFSSCLVAVCTMQLLLLFLKLLDNYDEESSGGGSNGSGNPTDTPPDDMSGFTFLSQCILNSMGIYAGALGARSANTLNPHLAKRYFYWLVLVGTTWICLRVIWAINTVEAGYDVEVGPPPRPEHTNGTSPGQDGNTVDPDVVPRSELMYMVSLSIMIYISIWSMCFLRASQFYRSVLRSYGTLPA